MMKKFLLQKNKESRNRAKLLAKEEREANRDLGLQDRPATAAVPSDGSFTVKKQKRMLASILRKVDRYTASGGIMMLAWEKPKDPDCTEKKTILTTGSAFLAKALKSEVLEAYDEMEDGEGARETNFQHYHGCAGGLHSWEELSRQNVKTLRNSVAEQVKTWQMLNGKGE